jgi:hypothetical protein
VAVVDRFLPNEALESDRFDMPMPTFAHCRRQNRTSYGFPVGAT